MSDSLYDHYKDTCQTQRAACSLRNRFFLALLILVFALGAFTFDPQGCEDAAAAVLAGYGFDLSVSGRVVQTLLWVGVLYTYIRYLQLMTTIERDYLYLNKIERELKGQGCLIDREGTNYSMGWPLLSKAIDLLYKCFFIVLFEVVLFSKAIIEGFAINVFSLIDWTVLILFTALTVLYWIYLWEVNKAYDEMDVEVEDS
ncbi:hypothetical protein [Enorma phocaeensis]|uniref:hypothetical protein n=1 Tax=Enorma phocaeensis TaxID=1871019 RepID=UPI00195A2BA6|nr:hypothetical protein [Enorma phocaeensis]MBM6953472.1 hypothetical protein [Enorma phocaeensis]